MQQLIKITSVPIQTMSYRQNARLVSSDSVDLERRKALARQMSFHRSAGRNAVPMKDIAKINRTFSKRTVTAAPQGQNISRHEAAFQQVQSSVSQATAQSVPASIKASSVTTAVTDMPLADSVYTEVASTAVPVSSGNSVSMEATSSYATERGAFEMKVAKGDLTFLPPMVMTIVTQRPELHFEYLGDFNYVPPRAPQVGGSINLAT